MTRIIIASEVSVPSRLFGRHRRELNRIGDLGLSLIIVGGVLASVVGFRVGQVAIANHCGVRIAACAAIDTNLILWLVYIGGISTALIGFLLVAQVNVKLRNGMKRTYVLRGGWR